ncbi:hypothetical protein B0I35DRAFT_451436 [Stachybotrys elegans]|uniref:Uncharacterized protein n=1 Tax=Stachybotrys elegans TaxID=80388 RepID=A0A8K0SWY0_9HYPO|nr:hypothetical protein B0I35DRAFT_451436 [Stachybotrys elegans]
MDDTGGRRRQHEQPAQQTSNPRYQDQPPHSRALSSSERYRPGLPTASPSTPRGMGTNSYSAYYPESSAAFPPATMSATTTMGYGPDYGSDARQPSQNFGSYNASPMMYNVPQANAQGSVYDTNQFGHRQSSSMQLMTPDVTSTYFSSETGGGSASAIPGSSQTSGATASVFQQTPSMSYGPNISSVGNLQQSHGPASADASMAEDNEAQDGGLEEKWLNYQRQLGAVFQDISRGSLENASDTLLSISNWLLSQVDHLGLSTDDSSLHSDRLKLWNDFNHAWLALGHRQRELMSSGQQLSRAQRLMSHETVSKMGNELVRLCDLIERHGLVDYQYGVWEEQIESVFEDCLDILEREAGDLSTMSH